MPAELIHTHAPAVLLMPESLPPLREVPGRRRIVKDALRAGRWRVGEQDGVSQYWEATPE